MRTISDHGMFQAGDKVLVAVSGGADSVVLVNLLRELAPRLSITLGVAHLNHGLRSAAAEDARFVKALARKLGLPFFLKTIDAAAYSRRHGLSLEEGGREARYTFYNTVLTRQNYQKIALGHHRADNAEVVLMNLLRGAGPLGLSGIPPVRENRIVRPLVNLSRGHIRTYLDHHRLAYRSDPSNTDPRFTRNRVRHALLPLLEKEFNTNVIEALHRTAEITGDENRWIESLVDPLYDAVTTRLDPGQLSLDAAALGALERAPARRVIRRAIAALRGHLRRVTLAHIDTLVDLAGTGKTDARVDLPGLISGIKREKQLILKVMNAPREPLTPANPPRAFRYCIEAGQLAAPEGFNLTIAETGARIFFRRQALEALPAMPGSGQQTALFDIEQLSFPLLIRNWQPGDRFTPLGMRGSKKLKKLFNERRVERNERGRCPVMVSGGDIIWVLGHQRAESGKIGRQTRHVLEVKYVLPDIK